MIKLNLKKYIVIAAVIFLLIILHYAKLLAPLESVLKTGLNPAFKGFYSLGAGLNNAYLGQTSKLDLASELKKAEERLNQLTVENVKLRFLQDENDALRKQLNFFSQDDSRYLMANVISRGALAESGEGGQAILIDKGARDGLSSGLAVVSSTAVGSSTRGVIIGKIAKVEEQLSQVYLITNKNCKLAAAIFGETKTSGITAGDLGLTVKMDFIPQTENIKVGDIAATSGLEQNVPRGLVIGRVTEVIKENNEVWQAATIEPMVDLGSLSVVSILLPR
ncbi:MAG: rod shape-determining protein MreC [bacterium]|nr:rod shape-determining protein MreC [bacterium]